MELFDKNFNDSLVDLDGRTLHAVTFHTVPAFGFGGSDAFNIARNHAQLAFLEWYLLGSCDPAATTSKVRSCQTEIRPLEGKEPFIAIGDLNVDWQSTSPGAAVLKRILADRRVNNWRAENYDHHFRLDPEDKRAHTTFLSGGGDERGDFDLGKLQSELDYWLVSRHFKIEHGRVVAPPSYFKDHGCHATKAPADAARAALSLDPAKYATAVSTRYLDSGARQYCVVSAAKPFQEFRKGSDHLPTYVTVSWATPE
jgi:endonuclease/exonuclease/phosphatase family metal-dependent hydrolase